MAPREDEGEQELSMLAPPVWKLSLGVFSFGAGLWQVFRRDPDAMFELLGGKAGTDPQSLWACERDAKGR